MSTITKERAAGIARGEKCYTHDDVVELARIALASLEAEPVAFVMADDLKESSIISTPAYRDLGEAMERTVGDLVALHAIPPSQASLEARDKLSNFVASQEPLGKDFEKVLAENIEGLYVPDNSAPPAPVVPAELHPETQKLVTNFCTALAEKLYKAQIKYGYDADWKQDGWPTQCQSHFHQHIAKGDPRDVASYCAFMWYHGWKTEPAPVSVLDLTALDNLAGEMLNHAMNCERRVAVAYTHCAHRLAEEVRDLRAAMLQGAENAESPTTMKTASSMDSSPKIAESPSGNSPVIPECSCHTCRPVTFADSRFVVCPECGNKRCPHANDHRNACTGSNEPGQEGSAYPAAPQQEAVSDNSPLIPDGWKLVPVEPTEDMIVNGFESEPDESFSDEKEWEEYDAMSGCQQAAHRAKLCWAAMVHAAPKYDANKKLN